MTLAFNLAAKRLQRFRHDEAGAVTVDWVVLTAVLLAMTIMLFTVLTPTILRDAAAGIAGGVTAATVRQ